MKSTYYERNRAKCIAIQLLYYNRNREYQLARMAEYNKEYYKQNRVPKYLQREPTEEVPSVPSKELKDLPKTSSVSSKPPKSARPKAKPTAKKLLMEITRGNFTLSFD